MRRVAFPFLVVVLALAWPGASALAADKSVSAEDNFFSPKAVSVFVGNTVTWHNNGSNPHNVWFNNGKKLGGTPVTHQPSPDPWTAKFTFMKVGVFRYYCSQHGTPSGFGMVGKVTVTNPNDHTPPKITNLTAKPGTLCTKQTQTCKHPGTHVKFTLSEDAGVKAAVKPDGTKKPFSQVFTAKGHKGKNDVKWGAKGLKPGKYVLRLQATDANKNKSKFATTKITIRKS